MAGSNLAWAIASRSLGDEHRPESLRPRGHPMKKLLPYSILVSTLCALAFTSTGCRAARNDERLDKLESRVSALEAKVDMMHKP
jgi:hypothetical protein